MQKKLAPITRALVLIAIGASMVAPASAETAAGTSGRRPYTAFQVAACARGTTLCRVEFPPVPEGKRLVVRDVNSGIFFVERGIRSTLLLASDIPFFLVPRTVDSSGPVVVHEAILAFFEPGQAPIFQLVFNDPEDAPLLTVTLTGYLVDAQP